MFYALGEVGNGISARMAATSERMFSMLGNIISARHNELTVENVDMQTFLATNL